MSVLELLVLLLVAGVCGALGKAIVGYFPGGFLASIGVGFVGALIGTWVARLVGLPELFAVRIGGTAFPICLSVSLSLASKMKSSGKDWMRAASRMEILRGRS